MQLLVFYRLYIVLFFSGDNLIILSKAKSQFRDFVCLLKDFRLIWGLKNYFLRIKIINIRGAVNDLYPGL